MCVSLSAQYIQFDLTSSLNYDGVGTQNEVTANVPGNGNFLFNSIGDHGIKNNSRGYTNQGSVGSGTAIPEDGILGGGKYQVSTAFDNGTDYLTKSNNMVRLAAVGGGDVDTFAFSLAPGEQGQYTSFNFLNTSQRDASATGYRTWVEAVYADGTVTVLDTGLSDSGDINRGTIGNNNFESSTDTYTFVNQAPDTGNTVGVTAVSVMDRGLGQTGSVNSVRSATRGLWEIDGDVPLDSSRTLIGLNFNIRAAGTNRDQEFYILGISATPIPEPSTYGLLFAAATLGVVIIRRRK